MMNTEDKKQIKLKINTVFHNNGQVSVLDFPTGTDGEARQRCKIQVEFAKSDVEQLKISCKDFNGVMKHYQEWLYAIVKINLGQEWTCIEGYDDVMNMIKEHIQEYF